jgi:hypothetical protein
MSVTTGGELGLEQRLEQLGVVGVGGVAKSIWRNMATCSPQILM